MFLGNIRFLLLVLDEFQQFFVSVSIDSFGDFSIGLFNKHSKVIVQDQRVMIDVIIFTLDFS